MAVVMIKIEDVEGLVEVSYTVDGAVPESSNKYSAALELASYLLAYADSILNPDDLLSTDSEELLEDYEKSLNQDESNIILMDNGGSLDKLYNNTKETSN